MWDSAEAKAKYEAWKKLGAMSRAEAMHLYVQAVEVFDADWIQWEGLRDSLPNGHAAPAPALTAGPVPAALGALQELRRGLPKLPPAQLVHVRAECKALLEALDAHGAPRA
eukprot:Transcript_23779.p3 GENE.Transcript_23779~~Transcript_23779.p3  ORF type:complete len:111 (+),score=44.27 Transcript_23779:753-1085(+)